MAAVRWLGRRVRGARPEDERAQVDRHTCRPDLRFELRAARPCGSLWERGLSGEVRERLRGGLDQGDEPGSLRSRLSSAEEESCRLSTNPRSCCFGSARPKGALFLVRAGRIAPPLILLGSRGATLFFCVAEFISEIA